MYDCQFKVQLFRSLLPSCTQDFQQLNNLLPKLREGIFSQVSAILLGRGGGMSPGMTTRCGVTIRGGYVQGVSGGEYIGGILERVDIPEGMNIPGGKYPRGGGYSRGRRGEYSPYGHETWDTHPLTSTNTQWGTPKHVRLASRQYASYRNAFLYPFLQLLTRINFRIWYQALETEADFKSQKNI